MPDDRVPVRMLAVGRGEKLLAVDAVRVVGHHRKLPADDLLLLDELIGGQRRVHAGVGEQVDGRGRARPGHVDPIHRAVEGRVGVDVAALVLDALGDGIGRAGIRPLEQHVFEQMRKSRAEVLALMDAPRSDPRLHAGHGRAAVFLHE